MNRRLAAVGVLVFAFSVLPSPAQVSPRGVRKTPAEVPQFPGVTEPDAQRTKQEFDSLLSRYPPTIRAVFKDDPTLMTQQQYLAAYPALAAYLTAHPEIALNPSYYLDGLGNNNDWQPRDRESRVLDLWRGILAGLAIFAGFSVAIALLTWLIRTFIDYRRWNRLSRVQAEVHTKLLDRFSTNEELMAYIATPAGSKFLQSAPISLDTGSASRSMGAPLSRIMWSLQAGLVLIAAGCGLMLASGRMSEDMYLPVEIMGIVALSLGVGFAVSAGVSFFLSHKMGLIEAGPKGRDNEV